MEDEPLQLGWLEWQGGDGRIKLPVVNEHVTLKSLGDEGLASPQYLKTVVRDAAEEWKTPNLPEVTMVALGKTVGAVKSRGHGATWVHVSSPHNLGLGWGLSSLLKAFLMRVFTYQHPFPPSPCRLPSCHC